MYEDAMELKMRKLWRNDVGMLEIWKAMRAILVGFPCIHLRSRTRQQSRGFGGFRKAGFHRVLKYRCRRQDEIK